MAGSYELARQHLESAMAAAKAENIDPERFSKALLSELLQQLRQHRSAADIRSEVAFELENLEGDQDFPFMRP
ncbi:MAG: hypothetical protein EA417_05930 [Gammaproteobacteria bacterium]|nr:MAG: hypothetical protein EA417_05930 [Gammaproteobacteria bacterium]